MTAEELAAVEREVNAVIRQDGEVSTRIMAPDDARALGAQALFGEKYGDEVRVVSMGARDGTGRGADGRTWSIELCGGTHVGRTGEIGAFVTLGDQASSAGVRRIEALTGQAALDHLQAQDRRMGELATLFRTPPAEVGDRVRALMDERRALQGEVARLRRDLASADGGESIEINGMQAVLQTLSGVSGKDLGPMVDERKQALGSGIVVLIADTGARPAVAAGVTKDLAGRVSAVDLVHAVVSALGGRGGGGRPEMAQGGGADFAQADEALAAARAVIEAA